MFKSKTLQRRLRTKAARRVNGMCPMCRTRPPVEHHAPLCDPCFHGTVVVVTRQVVHQQRVAAYWGKGG